MQHIGITQRVDVISSYGERRDALDQQWHQLFRQLGASGLPLPNQATLAPRLFEALALDAIILSGGNDPGDAPERDAMERAALQWAAEQGVPVVGICRGMQMINLYCGGSLQAVDGHVGSRHPLNERAALLADIEEVNSYHHFGIRDEGLAAGLQVLARAADGSIEAIRHNTLPWSGLMWHPEREQPLREAEVILLRHLLRRESS